MMKLFTAIIFLFFVHTNYSQMFFTDVAPSYGEGTCGGRQYGYCVLPNGQDQNSEVYKHRDSPYWSESQSESLCINWCEEHSFATGCELIRNQENRGCYLHTEAVSYGNGAVNHNCWICNENKGSGSCASKQNGFCVLSDGSDQNSGVYKAPGSDYWSEYYCNSWCEGEPHKTGCEYIKNQSNRGCYLHTEAVSHGNYANNHYCWICDPDNRRMLTNVVVDDSMVLWKGSHEAYMKLWAAEMAVEGDTSEENSADGRRRLLTVQSERKL